MLPKKLQKKLDDRQKEGSLRSLPQPTNLVDFSSNDYLGFASSTILGTRLVPAVATSHSIIQEYNITTHGATGSRLLSGNHKLYDVAEGIVSRFHESENALIFNSGYDANIGFFQSVPQRGDFIIYDEYIHASIRDGIQMSLARGYKFKHNDLEDLDKVIVRLREKYHLDDRPEEYCLYVATESVFSMDGDTPDLRELSQLCKTYEAYLIVDEAHAVGVLGSKGEGSVQSLQLQDVVFARIVTFGKAIGSHGAAILCSDSLKHYLVNYARSLIYTTGLPPHTLAMTISGYEYLAASSQDEKNPSPTERLQSNIIYFNKQVQIHGLSTYFIASNSAIHCALISGNKRVKEISNTLKKNGYDVRPILSPTVPKGQERLRMCLHSGNSIKEINDLLSALTRILT